VIKGLTGLRNGWDDRSIRPRGSAGGRVVKGQKPRGNRQGKVVSNVELGQDLLLELVSVPFQLRAAGVCIVILEDKLASNQAEFQRETGFRRRRSRRRRFALIRNGFSEGPIEDFVKVNAFHHSGRINFRIINEVGGVERVRLFTGDKGQSGRRVPAHESTAE